MLCRNSTQQQPPSWLLDTGPGQPGFKGQAAGGLQGRGSQCYFLFMRQGADLVAVPVDDWCVRIFLSLPSVV